MDRNEQQTIQALFEKLADAERQSHQRDAEAEAYIREQIARLPGATYYMAQTIIIQERALDDAQARIEELEQQAEPHQSSGGLFSGVFGDSRQPSRSGGSVQPFRGADPAMPQQPLPQAQPRTGGGFLAGAAQTAMGVAGGVLLGNAIEGMFGHREAAAEETPDDNSQPDDVGFDDSDFGDLNV
jgi:hypothetical protein